MLLSTAVLCLAMNVFHEARGEPLKGQVAVAMVTLNRAKGDPANVCAVVKRPKQFSWTNKLVDHKTGKAKPGAHPQDKVAWERSLLVAKLALVGWMPDVTGGATHYHTGAVKPVWRKSLRPVGRIGAHFFYQ